jgi:N-acetylglucosaminyldiphosphoundecaprenol N-acetyl-beta-D-mannosaminyltransferase
VSAPEAGGVRRRELLGVPFSLVDYEGAMDAMDALVERGERGYVCAVAVHALMIARRDAAVRDALLGASLVVPDGRPLVWALNALPPGPGGRLGDRVYGPELMDRYCARAAGSGRRVWLYGGATPQALFDLERALRTRHPGLEIAGGWSPPHRPLTAAEEREVARQIDGDRPDVVWVGIGAPKQELWMARMRPQLEAPVLAGVGAAFDFIAGRTRQAPAWMGDHGLEWLFRLSQDPFRLAPRYLRYNPAFLAAFARQYARERRQ